MLCTQCRVEIEYGIKIQHYLFCGTACFQTKFPTATSLYDMLKLGFRWEVEE